MQIHEQIETVLFRVHLQERYGHEIPRHAGLCWVGKKSFYSRDQKLCLTRSLTHEQMIAMARFYDRTCLHFTELRPMEALRSVQRLLPHNSASVDFNMTTEPCIGCGNF